MSVEKSLKHARESRMPSFGGLLPVTEIASARANDNVIVYSFKGYDTAKHRYILRPRLRSREFAGLMTPSRLQAPAKNCRPRWLAVMGFGAQAPNEARDALALTTQSRLIRRRVCPALTLRLPAALAGKTRRSRDAAPQQRNR
jgi:hypothetical protein